MVFAVNVYPDMLSAFHERLDTWETFILISHYYYCYFPELGYDFIQCTGAQLKCQLPHKILTYTLFFSCKPNYYVYASECSQAIIWQKVKAFIFRNQSSRIHRNRHFCEFRVWVATKSINTWTAWIWSKTAFQCLFPQTLLPFPLQDTHPWPCRWLVVFPFAF